MNYYSKAKYGNKKVQIGDITFDSQKEANRYAELKMLERCGAIKQLELQKKFVLIPAQYIDGKCVEKSVSYYADFCYFDDERGMTVIEDTKGVKTPDYIIKRKLMLYIHGIRIVEI